MVTFENNNGLATYTVAGKKNVFVGLTKNDADIIEAKKKEYRSYAAIPESFEVNTHPMVMNAKTKKYFFDINSKLSRKMNELDAGFIEIAK